MSLLCLFEVLASHKMLPNCIWSHMVYSDSVHFQLIVTIILEYFLNILHEFQFPSLSQEHF